MPAPLYLPRRYRSAGTVVPAASATDIATFVVVAGIPVRLLSMKVTGSIAAAVANTFFLIKRSAGNSGGTSTVPASVPNDAKMAAGSGGALVLYTANPAGLGATVGNVAVARVIIPSASVTASSLLLDFRPVGGLILTANGETVALNNNGVTLTSCTLGVEVEWEEGITPQDPWR